MIYVLLSRHRINIYWYLKISNIRFNRERRFVFSADYNLGQHCRPFALSASFPCPLLFHVLSLSLLFSLYCSTSFPSNKFTKDSQKNCYGHLDIPFWNKAFNIYRFKKWIDFVFNSKFFLNLFRYFHQWSFEWCIAIYVINVECDTPIIFKYVCLT